MNREWVGVVYVILFLCCLLAAVWWHSCYYSYYPRDQPKPIPSSPTPIPTVTPTPTPQPKPQVIIKTVKLGDHCLVVGTNYSIIKFINSTNVTTTLINNLEAIVTTINGSYKIYNYNYNISFKLISEANIQNTTVRTYSIRFPKNSNFIVMERCKSILIGEEKIGVVYFNGIIKNYMTLNNSILVTTEYLNNTDENSEAINIIPKKVQEIRLQNSTLVIYLISFPY